MRTRGGRPPCEGEAVHSDQGNVVTQYANAELPGGMLTFMLTDVEGSVALWEESAELMGAALARHDALIELVVDRYDGRLVRPRGEGDSRFAVFREASKAVAAAHALQRMLLSEVWPTSHPLKIRIGLHSGESDVRDGDYYGPVVNRCARLRAVARGSQVLVSETTAQLAASELPPNVSLRSLGYFSLRGLVRPEHVFQLTDPHLPDDFPTLPASSVEGTLAGYAPLETPAYPFPAPADLIGRERDLAQVLTSIDSARSLIGRQIFITAPAGIGKSTLVGAIVRRSAEHGALCLAGGAYVSTAIEPLRPVREALRNYVLARPIQQVRDEFRTIMPLLADLLPELRYLADSTKPPVVRQSDQIDQSALFGAITAFLQSLTARAPVLLCLEDLHAADAATLDFVRFLARQRRLLPVVLICTCRSDEVLPGSALALLMANLTRDGASLVELEPLGRAHTAQLAQALLGGPATSTLCDTLFSTTEGNPLFVEQLLLTLREEGRIARQEGVWQLVDDRPGGVPRIVRDVILRRLERLTPRCRGTLAMAAVLGESIDHQLLLAMCTPQEREHVLDDIEEAIAAQILRDAGSASTFAHPLVREALYAGLSTPRRMLLHSQAGTKLERRLGASAMQHAAELAHHFSRAGPDARHRAKALKYSFAAGRHAAALAAHREQLTHFAQAAELIRAGATYGQKGTSIYVDVLEGRGLAEQSLGRWQACIRTFRQVLEMCNEPIRRAQAYVVIARALHQIGQLPEALDACEQGLLAIADAAGAHEDSVRLQLQYVRAFVLLLQGRHGVVVRLAAQLVTGARRLHDPQLLFRAYSVLGLSLMCQGQLDAALEQLAAALATCEQLDDKIARAVTHESLGDVHYRAGDLVGAQHELESAIALYRDASDDVRSVLALQLISRVYLAQGDLDQAFAFGVQARAVARSGGDRWLARCLVALGGVHATRGDAEAAATCYEEALGTKATVSNAEVIVETLVGLGSAYAELGDRERAVDCYQRAHAVAQSVEAPPLVVSTYRALGCAFLADGDTAAAAPLIDSALKHVMSMPPSIERAPTLLAAAKLRVAQGHTKYGVQLAEEALAGPATAECQVHTHAWLGAIHLLLGQTELATHHSALAAHLAEHIGSPQLVAMARGDAARTPPHPQHYRCVLTDSRRGQSTE